MRPRALVWLFPLTSELGAGSSSPEDKGGGGGGGGSARAVAPELPGSESQSSCLAGVQGIQRTVLPGGGKAGHLVGVLLRWGHPACGWRFGAWRTKALGWACLVSQDRDGTIPLGRPPQAFRPVQAIWRLPGCSGETLSTRVESSHSRRALAVGTLSQQWGHSLDPHTRCSPGRGGGQWGGLPLTTTPTRVIWGRWHLGCSPPSPGRCPSSCGWLLCFPSQVTTPMPALPFVGGVRPAPGPLSWS